MPEEFAQLNYFPKEILMFCKETGTFFLSNRLNRIEYGSITSDDKANIQRIFKKDPQGNSYDGNQLRFDVRQGFLDSNWTNGPCQNFVSLEKPDLLFACEICFMHQYGLHRTKDNVSALCDGTSTRTINSSDMKKCYWGPLPETPEKLSNESTTAPFVDEQALRRPFCLPDDIPAYNPSQIRFYDQNFPLHL